MDGPYGRRLRKAPLADRSTAGKLSKWNNKCDLNIIIIFIDFYAMGDMGEVSTPVYAVYYPDDLCKSPQEVFPTVKEAAKCANTPVGKSNGARFKKFGTCEEAKTFLSGGSICCSPLAFSTPIAQPSTPVEPVLPYPSLSKIQMNEFKKTIEGKQDDKEKFTSLVSNNPRYLVNAGADTATIIMEGFRYNALHIAAKSGRYWFVEQILNRVTDLSFLSSCYGLPEEDVEMRRENILLSYLNTPDKGNHDTPLIIAAKFGFVEIVRILVKQPLINREAKNKEGKTAIDVVCSRFNGEDKGKLEAQISSLISAVYVAIYRSGDSQIKPVVVSNYPDAFKLFKSLNDSFESKYSLAACAGPFDSCPLAEEFLIALSKTGSDIKKRDIDKGYERVARELCETNKVSWSECWFFLGQGLYDFSRIDDLDYLNKYLCEKRKDMAKDPIKKRLSFGDCDEDYIRECVDDDVFEDALETSDVDANDSLASLVDKFGNLYLHSPIATRLSVKPENEESDGDLFCTPPSTPPAVFILDEPTKTDNDLFLALSLVSMDHIDKFLNVKLFVEKLSKMNTVQRADWPAKDSPRRAKSRTRRF